MAYIALWLTAVATLCASDISGTYEFNSVRIGAGGFVAGFVSHPLNANVRYCRTDVGNAYRWDTTLSEWVPMIVRNLDGSGIPSDVAAVPGKLGCSSVAIDPNNINVVLIAFPVDRSDDLKATYPELAENVFRSTDGGRNFTKGNLSVPGAPNGPWHYNGERLKVDPNNSNIVYFCTYSSGLYRSLDAGATWAQVTGSGAPLTSSTVCNIHIYKNGGTTSAFGQTVSSILYAVGGDTDVFRSGDGGQSWSNITSGTTLSTHTMNSTLDQNGVLWVPQHGANKLWKYNGAWSTYSVSTNSSYGTVQCVAVDPANANRLFTISSGGCVSRSLNGGSNWTVLGPLNYANSFGWLPQMVAWRSNGGITFDANGELWVPQGNEGVLRYMPLVSNTETNIRWTIDSAGIEEMVAQDVIIPRGSGDKVLTASEDTTGHLITNPDQFTAKQDNVQTSQLLSVGNGLAACPNATNFVAISTSDAFNTSSGNNFSGYSNDGGSTWTQFPSNPKNLQAGSIAVSRRNGWTLGSDHFVILPCGNKPPYYSKDGGSTWTATASFPLDTNGNLNMNIGFYGFWNVALKQRQLKADPFVADKYFLNLTDGGFFVTIDGGVTWTGGTTFGLPRGSHNGQLEVNYTLQDDLWFVDGLGGSYYSNGRYSHGLYHSIPGSNYVFTKVPGIDYAYSLALGAGRGKAGDAAYTVYFYGKLTGDASWGVFRSVDGGSTWDRLCYYPTGLIDQVTCMAASWDTFGLVYLGFMGHSYVYGQPTNLVFSQNFNRSQTIADYTGTNYNLFTSVEQGTGGGYSISSSNELIITHGTDTSNHIMPAMGSNLMNPLQRGFILNGTVRPTANPNSLSRTTAYLQFGTSGTTSSEGIYFNSRGTSVDPQVCMQPQNGVTTGTVNSSAATPFWLVVNKTGASITYTRPDGQSKTLGTGKLDLWFGADGNNGPVTDIWLADGTCTVDSFWFRIPGSSLAYSCAVAIDNLKVYTIDVGTTQF